MKEMISFSKIEEFGGDYFLIYLDEAQSGRKNHSKMATRYLGGDWKKTRFLLT